ncbi:MULTISPECIES: alpha/beta hydrolase [unclassified Photobacterium]|uniref:alpha/beta fold hydrolase n=1 Tax=unclassified Photobacterium TaxID=2628852 RepID=UPI001EDEB8D7|nr:MULTISPECIES: alpha/beta hydrolase [unclassified Photobacterium]MCG3864754.1 alpha/beta hydrolase [Photobacterium sp. Ph6]MCG3876163.1 alpha/beta hydrolase [Photobacterium sp. Ph5]
MTQRHTIILLRGLFRDQFHWGTFCQTLKNHFPHSDIVCLDIAGNGARNDEKTPPSLKGIAQDLHEHFHILRPQHQQADIIAISMGGMIALKWMAMFPNDIRKAILINTSTQSLSPFHQRLRWQRYADISQILWLPNLKQEEKIIHLTSNKQWDSVELIALSHQWANWKEQHPISCKNMFNQLNASREFTLPNKLSQPIVLLTSQQDKLVNYQCSIALAHYWNLPINIHPTAGHDIPLDDPQWVCEHAKRFL